MSAAALALVLVLSPWGPLRDAPLALPEPWPAATLCCWVGVTEWDGAGRIVRLELAGPVAGPVPPTVLAALGGPPRGPGAVTRRICLHIIWPSPPPSLPARPRTRRVGPVA